MKTLKLFPVEKKNFGQDDLSGQRKQARPFSPNCPMHLIIKSKCAVFKSIEVELPGLINKHTQKYQIRIYSYAHNWNHIHLLIQSPDKKSYVNFVRNLTSAISRKSGQKGLFEQRPYTRLIKWGRDFTQVKSYIELNKIEALGYNRFQASEIQRISRTASKE